MKIETTAATLLMCALITLSPCTKKPHTPTEEPQPAEVGFTAASQAVWVKGETDPKTTFPYTDFGVWGIARNTSVASPYILWTSNQLTEVSAPEGTQTNKEETNIVFTPTEAAYWLRDYSYDFLAIAPYNPGLTNVAFTLKDAAGNTTGKDYMTFTYDMSSKYASGDYAFDLLGAAAQYKVETGGYSTAQNLMFWHLLSQISFELKFGTDATGQQINGTVKAVSLSLRPEASFSILHDDESTQSTAPLHTEANATQAQTVSAPLAVTANASTYYAGPINIVPQTPADLILTVDFELEESEESKVDYSLDLDLAAAQIPEKYLSNNRYSYRITIGTNASIAFHVTVNQDWAKEDGEINM